MIVRIAHTWMSTIFIYIYFGHLLIYTHKQIYISFSLTLIFGFRRLVPCMWFCRSDQNVIIKFNIASITHSQLILVSCFVFFFFFLLYILILLSFTSIQCWWSVMFNFVFHSETKKKKIFCIKKNFMLLIFLFIETFIVVIYGNEKLSHSRKNVFSICLWLSMVLCQ